jgi:ATP-dependent exoDNAse (exonuclease V) alpha subunit
MVIEQTRGKEKGRGWHVESVNDGRAYARSDGQVREFNKSHANSFDVCEKRELELAIGDDILMRSASKRDGVTNGERLRVAGWDEYNNPVSADGRIIWHRNLCHAYAATVRRVQGDSATRVIVGFDRHSVKTATRDAAYVAGSRGREFCEVQVESISELSQIQNRCGDRKAVME